MKPTVGFTLPLVGEKERCGAARLLGKFWAASVATEGKLRIGCAMVARAMRS